MFKYLVKSNVVFMGIDQFVIESNEVLTVGQTVSLSPTASTTLSDGRGGSVTLSPGVTFTGTVVKQV